MKMVVASMLVAFLIACKTQEVLSKAPLKASENEVFELLLACPSSTNVDSNDSSTCNKIIITLQKIASYDSNSIRAAMTTYFYDVILGTLPKSAGTLDIRNLRLLNRIVFNVPPEMDLHDYWNWDFKTFPLTLPVKNGRVQLLWPLERGVDGVFTLKGRFDFDNHLGSNLEPVGEFDDFERRFGRRPLPVIRTEK
jgi:hypothetical protein